MNKNLKSAFLLSVLLAAGGCANEKTAPHARPAIPVVTAVAKREDFKVYYETVGSIVAVKTADITPQVSALLMNVYAQEGSFVEEGDALFALDDRAYKYAVDQAQALVEQEKIALGFAQETLKRNESLREQNYISDQEYDNLVQATKGIEAKLQGNIAALEKAKIDLSYCKIKAPFKGKLGRLLVNEGNYVTTGTSLINLTAQDPVYIEFAVQQNLLEVLKQVMQKKRVVSAQLPTGEMIEGVVSFLDNSVNVGTGTLLMRAVVANQEMKACPGFFVYTKLMLDTLGGALVVPSQAVGYNDQGRYIFVITDGNKIAQKLVTISHDQNGQCVITSGLKEGDKVVIDGQINLFPGAIVTEVDPVDSHPQAS